MTTAETPTECAVCETAMLEETTAELHSHATDLHARIRELEGLIRRYRVSGNSFRWIQKVKAVRAALARSEEKPRKSTDPADYLGQPP